MSHQKSSEMKRSGLDSATDRVYPGEVLCGLGSPEQPLTSARREGVRTACKCKCKPLLSLKHQGKNSPLFWVFHNKENHNKRLLQPTILTSSQSSTQQLQGKWPVLWHTPYGLGAQKEQTYNSPSPPRAAGFFFFFF